ncbi:hypothetical protein SAMN05216232_0218 [Virgibacillus subterraneus]|uniref:Uncharacterized protein n=1 Tax=Virgibacillus subterraneus TaxID=621109 RepID=A0A1H8Z019_9BACI|nr:hypothetical protein [Virgibacillus subterraneus]SEP57672.1 hypothetical protein SAMN05216232_0218 [Virgibacillus subterraneus]
MTFLKDDQARAQKELDCYNYCIKNASVQLESGEFGQTAAYLDNASRSMRELEKLKIAKQTFDKHWWEIKQIEGQQEVDRVIANMGLGR